MDLHPAAYIRRSHVDPDSPGDISEATQLASVRKLAAADGHNGDLVVYSDWGISADARKAARRTAYARLLADMEAGRVSAVYAFDVDRLYRDPRDLIRLQDAARRHRVPVTTKGGILPIGDDDDPTSEGFTWISAVFGRMELLKARKRARAAIGARLARGDRLGHPPFGFLHVHDESGRVVRKPNPAEPVEPIMAVWRKAGSFAGAATLLNAAGIKPRHAKAWSGVTVARVVRQAAPEAVPARLSAGRRARHASILGRVMRCPCGGLMVGRHTSTRSRYGTFGPYVSYQCPRGRYNAAHPRPYMVQEAIILPWVRDELAHLQLVDPETGEPIDAVTLAADHAAEREALAGRLERANDLFIAGKIARERYDAEDAAIAEALTALGDAEMTLGVTPIRPEEWDTWAPDDLNSYIRAIVREIRLRSDMRPVSALWRNPALRRACDDPACTHCTALRSA